MQNISEILNDELISLDGITVHVYNILGLVIFYASIYAVLWAIKRYLKRKTDKHLVNKGKSLAIYKIAKYFIFTIAFILSLDSLGIPITILLASSTALFVGIGLGLQQTFNDFISGFILIFEGTIKIGDIVEINGVIGKIQKVDIRTSKVLTRDNTLIILPNSVLANNNLINWSYNRKATRFSIEVGVAYGSDTKLVSELLKQAAREHNRVLENEPVYVKFNNFGNSSLDFSVKFFSMEMFDIERIKSEIRFTIDEKFRANKVTIPFPQRDLHLYNHE
jgi:small-conductance mechanosensitive channel